MSPISRALIAALAALAVLPGAGASAAPPGSATGTVILPGGHELLVLRGYGWLPATNGLIGYVIDLGPSGLPSGTPVKLTETSPEPVELDVVFTRRLDGPLIDGGFCNDAMTNDEPGDPFNRSESGTVSCPGGEKARYAVVVMVYGVAGSFKLQWG